MKLKTKGIIGFTIYALAMFCFSMAAGFHWIIIPILWMVGVQATYLLSAHSYMTKFGVSDAKNTTIEHEANLENIFLKCLVKWPAMW